MTHLNKKPRIKKSVQTKKKMNGYKSLAGGETGEGLTDMEFLSFFPSFFLKILFMEFLLGTAKMFCNYVVVMVACYECTKSC